MVTHVVLFKMKDPSTESVLRARDVLAEMKGRIPGLLDVEVGVDFLRSERSFDVALITRHESREALEAYQVHPIHQKVLAFMVGVRDRSVCVDFSS
ncbi:MAG TPA: Dabb family protein [Polyangiaceae bacterium]|nr:Dabb family protein [Polyangiaceae bacterium]